MSVDDQELEDTGVFCQHWADPSDCEEECALCGHLCREHDGFHPHECEQDGCDCQGFVTEGEESDKPPGF